MTKTRKKDQRTLKTTQAFKDTLLEMVFRDEEISVLALTKAAGKSRNTFYIHYSGVQDVIDDIEQDILEMFEEKADAYTIGQLNDNPELVGIFIDEIVIQDDKLCKLTFGSSFSSQFIRKLIDDILNYLDERYQSKLRTNDFARSSICFLTAGLMYTLYDWYRNQNPLKAQEVIARLGTLSREGVSVLKIK